MTNAPNSPRKWDLWRLPTMLLWLAFFFAGLLPAVAFSFLREAGYVVTQNALVNSPHVITLALAGYVAFFVYYRCLEADIPKPQAQDKALQLGLFAWLAFLPVDFPSIALVHTNPLMRDRALLYFVAAVKLASWWTLLLMFMRYYLAGADTIFANVATLFPSSRRAANESSPEQRSSQPVALTPRPSRTETPQDPYSPKTQDRPDPGAD